MEETTFFRCLQVLGPFDLKFNTQPPYKICQRGILLSCKMTSSGENCCIQGLFEVEMGNEMGEPGSIVPSRISKLTI